MSGRAEPPYYLVEWNEYGLMDSPWEPQENRKFMFEDEDDKALQKVNLKLLQRFAQSVAVALSRHTLLLLN